MDSVIVLRRKVCNCHVIDSLPIQCYSNSGVQPTEKVMTSQIHNVNEGFTVSIFYFFGVTLQVYFIRMN